MTIIVVRDGVMAADTARWSGSEQYKVASVNKLHLMNDGSVFGACGNSQDIRRAIEFLSRTDFADRPKIDDSFQAIILRPDGTIWNVFSDLVPMMHAEPMAALSYGEVMAIGALEAGATAAEAVAICIKRSAYCGGEVTTVNLSRDLKVAAD